MHLRQRSTPVRYLLTFGITILAVVFSNLFLYRHSPFLPCIVAVTVSSRLYGRGAGLFSCLISVACTSFFLFGNGSIFHIPAGSAPSNESDIYKNIARELMFVGVALTIVFIMTALRRYAIQGQNQNERLGNMLNSVASGVIAVDGQGRVTYLNPLAGKLTGWGQDAVGRALSEVFNVRPDAANSLSETWPLIGDPFEDVAPRHTPAQIKILLSKDGQRHVIEDSSAEASLAFSEHRDTVLVFREVTGQHRVEGELRQALERQRIALDAGKLAAWEWDLKTDQVFSKDLHKLFPMVAGSTTSKMYFDFIQPDDALALKAVIEKSIETRQPYQGKSRCIYPDNELVWLESYGKPVYNAQGEAIRIIGVSRNITEDRLVEEIVREGQEQFRSLAETAKDGILSTDSSGKIIYANASCAAVFGYSRAALIGKHVLELIPERLRARCRDGLARYKATGVKQLNWASVEFPGLRKEGSEVPLEMSYSETRSGQKHLFTAVIRDISERKKNEQLVLAAKERLVLAQRIAGIGTYEWDIASGRTHFSLELEAIYGMTPTTFGGLHDYRMALIHPDDLQRVDRELRTALDSRVEEFGTTFRVLLPDKSVRWIASNGKIFRDHAGAAETMLGAERDITRQKEFEAEREKLLLNEQYAAERLAFAQRAAGMGTYERDFPTGRVKWTPEMEALFGLPAGAFDGHFESWIALIHPEDRYKRQEWLARAIEEGGDYYVEYRVIWPDCGVHWLGNKGKIIFNSNGEPEMSIGACFDITQRRALEAEREVLFQREREARAEAERSNRLKDEFIATVSHELRTPLTAIMGWSHMLLEGGLDQTLVARGLESIERNAQAQARLVEDLLDLSRITAGRMRLQLQPLDLAQVIQGVVDGLRPAALGKKIEFDLFLTPATINGDADRLHQIAYNIIFNALKYSERGRRIEINVQPGGDTARLVVRDHGKGIAPEFLPKLFRLFSQEDASSTRRFGGMGLGLAIVKQLVELHGGTVTAESAGENQGTTVTVELPLHKSGDTVLLRNERQHGAAAGAGLGGRWSKLEGMRVLIVESDADTRGVVASLLRQSGARVAETGSADEALDLFLKQKPDAALIDISLVNISPADIGPGQDGIALLRKIRALPVELGGQVPAIAFTPKAGQENVERLRELGFQKLLLKAATPDDIRDMFASFAD